MVTFLPGCSILFNWSLPKPHSYLIMASLTSDFKTCLFVHYVWKTKLSNLQAESSCPNNLKEPSFLQDSTIIFWIVSDSLVLFTVIKGFLKSLQVISQYLYFSQLLSQFDLWQNSADLACHLFWVTSFPSSNSWTKKVVHAMLYTADDFIDSINCIKTTHFLNSTRCIIPNCVKNTLQY